MSDLSFLQEIPIADWEFPYDDVSQKFIVGRLRALREKARKIYATTGQQARTAILIYLEYFFEFGAYNVEDLIYCWEWLLCFDFRVADTIKYGEVISRNGGGVDPVLEKMKEFVQLDNEPHAEFLAKSFWFLN